MTPLDDRLDRVQEVFAAELADRLHWLDEHVPDLDRAAVRAISCRCLRYSES